MNDISVVYDLRPEPLQVQTSGWQAVVVSIFVEIVRGVIGGMKEAAVSAGKDLLAMFTVERLTAALTDYAREQAGSWVTKTILDAGNQEWLATALHAFGLDVEDLLTVSRNALDRGFTVLTEDLGNAFRQSGNAQVEASAAMQGTVRDHALIQAQALGDWTLFETLNYNAEEEKNRANTAAIFGEDEDKVRTKARFSSEENVLTFQKVLKDSFFDNVPEYLATVGKAVAPVQNWLNDMVLTARNFMYDLLVPSIPVSYEQVGATAVTAFAAAAGMGFAAHGLAVAADLVHPLKQTGFPQLAAFLADMAGFGAIARETWYEDMKNFLGTPYHHYSLRYFRPTLPGKGDLMQMMTEGNILQEDFQRAMQYWGYRDPWIEPMLKAAYRDISPTQIALALEDPTIGKKDMYAMLRSANINIPDCEIMTEALTKKALRSYIMGVRSALMSLRKEGYITEDQLDDQLAPLGLRSEAHALTKKEARLKYIFDFTTDSISMFVDMYTKDLIDENDLAVSLAGLGIEQAKRDLIINRQKVKRLAKIAAAEKKEVKKEIREQQELMQDIYIASFRAGTLTADALYAALVFAGISAEVATLTVELEKQKKITVETKKAVYTYESEQEKIRKKYETGYIDLFRKDLIDEDTLYAYLLSLEFEDDYVQSIVDTETYKKLLPPAVPV